MLCQKEFWSEFDDKNSDQNFVRKTAGFVYCNILKCSEDKKVSVFALKSSVDSAIEVVNKNSNRIKTAGPPVS